MSEAPPILPDVPRAHSRGLSRRSFLVLLGATALGTFTLPDVAPAATDAATPPLPPGPDDVGRRVLKLVGPVVRSGDGRAFAYLEKRETGDYRVMIWHPEGDAERAEAERFCAVANYRRWHTPDDIAVLMPPAAGPWLVRLNADENYLVLAQAYGDWLLARHPPDRKPAGFFSDDPATIGRFSRGQVLELIPLASTDFGIQMDAIGVYFEPVAEADMLTNFRQQLFGPASAPRK